MDAIIVDFTDDEWDCEADAAGLLTGSAMRCPQTGWYAALTRPIPDAPPIELLDLARQWVLLYLDWVTGDLALRAPPKELAHAIKLGADRLRELGLAMKQALADEECPERFDEPFVPPMRSEPPPNFFRGPLI
jgi:hypothetical protein